MISNITMSIFRHTWLFVPFLMSATMIAGPISSGGENSLEFAKEVFKSDNAVNLAKEALSRVGWSWTYTNNEGEESEFPVEAVQISAECRTGVGEFPCSLRYLVVQTGTIVVNKTRKFDTVKAIVSIDYDGSPVTELFDIVPN